MAWRQQMLLVAIVGVFLFATLSILSWIRGEQAQEAATAIQKQMLPEIIQLKQMRSGALITLTAVNEVVLIRTTIEHLSEQARDADDLEEDEEELAGELQEIEEGRTRVRDGYAAYLALTQTPEARQRIEEVYEAFSQFWDAGLRILTLTENELDFEEIDEAKEEFEDREEELLGLIDILIADRIAANEASLAMAIDSVEGMALQAGLTGLLGIFVLVAFVLFSVRLMTRQEDTQAALRTQTETAQNALRQAEEARNQAMRLGEAKTSFLAMMSHEIRTPMNGVIGMIDLMEHTKLSAQQSQYLNIIRDSAFALLSVINDVLDLTRMQTGRFEIRPEPVEIAELISSVTDLMQASLRQKGLGLNVSVDGALPTEVLLDPIRIRQVLTNIVGNAVKFTDQGSISVKASVAATSKFSGKALRIDIADTGPGIADAEQHVIFEPFTQADSSLSRRHDGAGLGLSICKSLVEAMGGTIDLESAPEKGSIFSVWVPLRVAEEPANANLADAGDHKRPNLEDAADPDSALRVLIVDDNEVNRIVAEEILISLGHVPRVAGSGSEAVKLAATDDFDLVFMDLQMHGMDGFETMARIRESAGPGQAPAIVAMTAHASEASRENAMARGMEGFLAKPVTRSDVAECVAAFTTGRARKKPA